MRGQKPGNDTGDDENPEPMIAPMPSAVAPKRPISRFNAGGRVPVSAISYPFSYKNINGYGGSPAKIVATGKRVSTVYDTVHYLKVFDNLESDLGKQMCCVYHPAA